MLHESGLYKSTIYTTNASINTHLKIRSQTTVIDSYIGPTRSLLKSIRPAVGDLKVPSLWVVALYVEKCRPPAARFSRFTCKRCTFQVRYADGVINTGLQAWVHISMSQAFEPLGGTDHKVCREGHCNKTPPVTCQLWSFAVLSLDWSQIIPHGDSD